MAAVIKLMDSVDDIVADTYDLKNDAEQERDKEYNSVVKIQAWFQGIKTRAYLRYLNRSAISIQRRWRGFLGRKCFRMLLENRLKIMRLNSYNMSAIKIQKHWRGYYTRKYVFNYYSRKRYLEGLKIKNAMILAELAAYKEQNEAIQEMEEEKMKLADIEYWARKHHHLLSTKVSPGIYNSPYLSRPMPEEYLLHGAKPLSHKKVQPHLEKFDAPCTSYDLPKCKVLPPLVNKPQGPFRNPCDVQSQRYKPFQPTLRVETDFYSVEKARCQVKDAEWLGRINDNYFQSFKHHSVPYEPLLHTTSKYGHPDYGNKYFREEFLDKHISSLAFQPIVPPIPIFEKLNDTYSQGQV